MTDQNKPMPKVPPRPVRSVGSSGNWPSNIGPASGTGPASAPVGVRAPGAANGERAPSADVGAPINRAGVAEGAAATWVGAWAIAATGMVAAITAPTVPARPSSASRRVMSASGPVSGTCGSAGSNRVDNCVTSKGKHLRNARWHMLHVVPRSGKREPRISWPSSSNGAGLELTGTWTSYCVTKPDRKSTTED